MLQPFDSKFSQKRGLASVQLSQVPQVWALSQATRWPTENLLLTLGPTLAILPTTS